VLVVRLLVVQTQEETTVQIQYLTQLPLLVVVVVVRRLFLPQVVKMVARAVVARMKRQEAQEFLDKVSQVVRA
jgi:flagellar biosynthesis protein FliQ